VTVGKRGLATSTVEVTRRADGETMVVAVADAAEYVRELVAGGGPRPSQMSSS
jgi:hypothetical protein